MITCIRIAARQTIIIQFTSWKVMVSSYFQRFIVKFRRNLLNGTVQLKKVLSKIA